MPDLKKMLFWRHVFLGFLILLIIFAYKFCGVDTNLKQKNSPDQNISDSSKTQNKSSTQKIILEGIEFPDNFIFGTASSDFQTTGGNGFTDWHRFINSEKFTNSKGEELAGVDVGTDFFNHYKEEFDLASQIGPLVHRLSLEWARIEPEENKFDTAAIERYLEIFSYMKSRGIEPMICLNHFALPLWFAEKGGWESPQAAFYYSRYAEVVARRIGLPLKIKWWLTFNEPHIILGQSYIKGVWPPFKSIENLQDQNGSHRLTRVTSNLMEAHRYSYRAIHDVLDRKFKVMVSFASAPGAFYPSDPNSPLDNTIANAFNFFGTLNFDYFVGASSRDFVGLNYYGREKLKLHVSWFNKDKPFSVEWVSLRQNLPDNRPKEFYPQGLYDMIMKFKDIGKPIIITENGVHSEEDKWREEFLVIHLKAVHDAIRDGADVIGYQHWTLADTWEWDGFFSKMGLIGIDRNNNFKRQIRPSALVYGNIIKKKGISKELLEKHKEFLP